MENTSTKIEKIVDELMKQITVVKATNEPTKEVGLIKTRVARAVDNIKNAQKDIEKEKGILEDLIWEQEYPTDTDITEDMLETLKV